MSHFKMNFKKTNVQVHDVKVQVSKALENDLKMIYKRKVILVLDKEDLMTERYLAW